MAGSGRERAVEGGMVVVVRGRVVMTCLGFEQELKKVEECTRNDRTPEKTPCALNNSLQRYYHSHLIALFYYSYPLKPLDSLMLVL